METEEILSKSLKETETLAVKVLDNLKKNNGGKSRVVLCLYGNLGAGKTAFTQILGKLLGVKETMQSPTFLIQKSYQTKDSNFKKLVHIDAYRIEDPKEMITLGFKETLEDPSSLVVIEWPEKIKSMLPPKTFDMNFEFIDETTRRIEFRI